MGSFTESATLELVDKSSGKIKKVNAELKQLLKTATQLEKVTSGRGSSRTPLVSSRNLQTIKALIREAESARHTVSTIGARVDNSGLRQTLHLVQQISREARSARQSMSGFGRGGTGRPAASQAPVAAVNRRASAVNSSFLRLASTASKLSAIFAAFNAGRAVVGEAGRATISSEDAATRVRQAGFSETETAEFVRLSREVQGKYPQIPAAEILNASVEQLSALKIAGKSTEDYRIAMERVAKNSQLLAVTYKDAGKGAEQARQSERFSQILGQDIDDTQIRKVQEAAMRAIVASGGEMTMEEAVRSIQQLGPTIAKSMGQQALTDLLLTRDEGGRASTAEWRTAIQDLMRDSLASEDKKAMAALGLRRKGGGASSEVVKAASENLLDFTRDTIQPLLEKAGLKDATSAEIGAWLDEFAGFTTSGARALADAAVSLRDGEVQRQREAARRANLDPNIGARTFRGATQTLVSSFDTAMARNLDKFGPIFAEGAKPVQEAIDLAGKQAEQGEFVKSAGTLASAVKDLATGKVGAVMGAIGAMEAIKTLLTPGTSTLDKAIAGLVLAGSTLLAAGNKLGDVLGADKPKPKGPVTAAEIAERRDESWRRVTGVPLDQVTGVPPDLIRPVAKTVAQFIREVQTRHGITADAIIGPKTTKALETEGQKVKDSLANVNQFLRDALEAAKENAKAAGVFNPPPPPTPEEERRRWATATAAGEQADDEYGIRRRNMERLVNPSRRGEALELGSLLDGLTTSTIDFASTFDQGTNQIAMAFSTGTTNISTAGTNASTSMQNGIIAGGNSAGAAIAAAMRNAAAGITIRVQQPTAVAAVDTGGQRPA